jgi:hypothetical protein
MRRWWFAVRWLAREIYRYFDQEGDHRCAFGSCQRRAPKSGYCSVHVEPLSASLARCIRVVEQMDGEP